MKNTLVLLFSILGFSLNAQIMLEHTYDSASTFSTISQLMLIDFEYSGERFVRIDRNAKSITIYDINHSRLKSFSYAGFHQSTNGISDILYISEQLFDPDPAIEYLYFTNTGQNQFTTSIYKEDGTQLFHEPNAAPLIKLNVPLQQFPIYNTTQGTKMLLSRCDVNQVNVYSLPGTLSTSIHQTNQSILEASSMSVSNPHPNPVSNQTTIAYQLPADAREGEIVFFNLEGKEIRRFRVDNTFRSLLISTVEIPAGTYLYHLRVAGDASAAKRMVVIR